ncbi:MAG TPA: lytic murein transglycosylase [Burkholderiaceae bacterium]|nr:lytic murein transglycosylase [Burkholderiaceae bacterium]
MTARGRKKFRRHIAALFALSRWKESRMSYLGALARGMTGPALLLALVPVAGAEPDLGRCLRQLRAEAPKHGVRREVFDQYTRDVKYDAKRALPDTEAPELKWPIWEYLAVLVDDQRIADGRRMMQEQRDALAKIEKRFGVDPATVVAIFGIETNFGAHKPRYAVIETFVNRSCGFPDARPAFKQEQKRHLFHALELLQSGAVKEPEFLGSRAGAFGMTQFMPDTYVRDRVDIDGDGRADIINSVPDALGASARFLVRNGWKPGLPWAVAVTLPAKFDPRLAAAEFDHARLDRGQRAAGKVKTIAQWRKLGVKISDERLAGAKKAYPAFSDNTPATLLLPEGAEAGRKGPAFLVTRNFVAFWRYNNSDVYAFAVGTLADLLRGEKQRNIVWSSNEVGLSRRQIAALQALLIKRGHGHVQVDGVPGPVTRDAVRSEERWLGWPETGYLRLRLLEALQGTAQ